MGELALSSLVSVILSVALWGLLPRGVVLTRSPAGTDVQGNPQYNTWLVRNESPLPIRLGRVHYTGINTFDQASGEIRKVELPSYIDDEGELGIGLRFDDEVLELTRDANDKSWSQQIVPPGDVLVAYVNLNRSLVIPYRRAGIFGVFERRTVRVEGGV